MALDHFEDNILGMLNQQELLDVGYTIERPADNTDLVFGNIKTDNLKATWFTRASQYNITPMAQYHAFDTEAQTTMPAPVEEHDIEKGLIKVKESISERMNALLNRNVTAIPRLVEEALRFSYELGQQVVERTLVAKNEVLATGKMTIKENNLVLDIDYGIPANHLSKTLDFGNGATEPLDEQLLALTEEAISNGSAIDTIYTSRAEFNKLRKNANIQKAVNGAAMVGQLVRESDLRDYLNDEFGFSRVIFQDNRYSKPLTMGADGKPVVTPLRLYPTGRMSFLSTVGGKVGDGLWGDPPEVKASRFMQVSGSEVSPYVYITQYAENDPAVVWTKASTLFIPVIYNPNSLYVATVTETLGG